MGREVRVEGYPTQWSHLLVKEKGKSPCFTGAGTEQEVEDSSGLKQPLRKPVHRVNEDT